MSKRFDREALLAMPHKDVKARYQAMFGEPPRSPNKTWMVNQMEEEHGRRKAARTARAEAEPTRARGRSRSQEGASTEAAQATEASFEEAAVRAVEEEPHAAEEEHEALPEAPELVGPSPSPRLATPEEVTGATHPVPREPRGGAHDANAGASEVPLEHATSGGISPLVRGRFRSMAVEELRTRYTEVVGRPTSSVDKHYLIWKIREAEKGKIRVGPVEPGKRREGTLAGADKTLPLTVTAHAVEAMDAAWMRTGFTSRMSFMRTAIREALACRGEQAAAALFPEKGGA